MSRKATKAALILAAALAAAPIARAQDRVTGDWLSPSGDAKVRIARCGESVCGSFLWFREPLDPNTGRPPLDKHNPNVELRSRPLIGMIFLTGFKSSQDGRWTHGRVYDPRTGHWWPSRLVPTKNGDLKLEGCVGPICEGQIWTPASDSPSEISTR
jgi:uncharacterized protein (DUF2147 family)